MTEHDIITFVEGTTQEQCRDLGNLLLELAEKPRDAKWKAWIGLTRDMMQKPEASSLVARIEQGRKRVAALSDGLLADGMGHQQLIEAELERRGDHRTFEQYRADVGRIESDVSFSA